MTVVINGSGTISGVTAGGLPSASITQANLATGVAGTGPAFSAYPSSAQSVTLNVATRVLFGTEDFDTNSNFASSRFTPTVAGYYQVSGGIQITTSFTTLIVYVYKNGASIKLLQYVPTAGAVSGSMLVYMNGSTDYLELYAVIGITQNLSAGATDGTFFQASLVRAA